MRQFGVGPAPGMNAGAERHAANFGRGLNLAKSGNDLSPTFERYGVVVDARGSTRKFGTGFTPGPDELAGIAQIALGPGLRFLDSIALSRAAAALAADFEGVGRNFYG